MAEASVDNPMHQKWGMQIRAEYSEAHKGNENYLIHALKCGEALIAAKKEIGKIRWPEFLKTQCYEMSERTLREWMRWAKPENKKKLLPPEIWQRVAKSEKGVVRAVREILKTERTQAQKDAAEKRKADNAKGKSKEVLEDALGALDVHGVVKVLGEVFDADFLAALGDELVKGGKDNLAIPPTLDRRQEQPQQFQRRT